MGIAVAEAGGQGAVGAEGGRPGESAFDLDGDVADFEGIEEGGTEMAAEVDEVQEQAAVGGLVHQGDLDGGMGVGDELALTVRGEVASGF